MALPPDVEEPIDLVVRLVDRSKMPPCCPECRRVIRPDVVLYGETLPDRHLKNADGADRSGV